MRIRIRLSGFQNSLPFYEIATVIVEIIAIVIKIHMETESSLVISKTLTKKQLIINMLRLGSIDGTVKEAQYQLLLD